MPVSVLIVDDDAQFRALAAGIGSRIATTDLSGLLR